MPIPRLALLVVAFAVFASPSFAAIPGPTLAREDTMRTSVPEVLVRAPRITLEEILDRVARGEARRESLIADQQFTATVRVVRGAVKDDPARLLEERVMRIYRKKPDRVRTVPLRHWKNKPDRRGEVQVSFQSDMSEEIVNFAFRPEARRDFRYKIVGRELLGNRVIYRIAFEPSSPLRRGEPSGLVWVDTNEFVIVRQEVDFERSPVPLLIKNIDRMVIERRRVQGHWVLQRVLLRAQTTVPLPTVGRSFDLSIHFDNYAINRGIADALFEEKGATP
jgi:hypothetical protein